MRIREGFKVREIAGEHIIVNQGAAGADLTKIISLNSSAKLLFESFAGRDFSVEDVSAALVERYGIDMELAARDAESWVNALKNASVIE